MNEPVTIEGWQAWDLLLRAGNQLRIVGKQVVGLDLGAAMSLAGGLGILPHVAAELLSDCESTVVAALNRAIEQA